MIKQVFTGGHFSSGTRLIQFLLEQKYNIANENEPKDFEEGFSLRPTLAERVLIGETPDFPEVKQPFSLKNPEFMFCFGYLKKLFPKSKTILVVRNGLDQILCNNRTMSVKYGKYFDLKETDYFKREMEFWNKAYIKALEGKPDLIFKLEDLVNDTNSQVKRLKKELYLTNKVDYSMIKKPDSMERYKKEYSMKLGHDVFLEDRVEEHIYKPEMIEELYKVGKEMMDYFGYGI